MDRVKKFFSCIWPKLNDFVNRYLVYFVLLVYIVISYNSLSNHTLNFDEINAWNISSNFKLFEIFEITKYEGHPFLWYVVLRPFAKYNLFFPHIMKILNFLFMFTALVIMWKKAPFDNFVKTCITLSSPIMIHTVYARNYAIGIMFLFLLCALYKKRLDHPVLYSLVILLLSNTNAMCLIGAIIFGVSFLYDVICEYIKDKTYRLNLIYVSIFFILCVCLLGTQLLGASPSYYLVNDTLHSRFANICWEISIKKCFYITYFLCLLVSFVIMKGIRFKIFLLGIFLMPLFIMLFIYNTHYWHHIFLWIYLVCIWWIWLSQERNIGKGKYVLYILVIVACFCFKVHYWEGEYDNFLKQIGSNISIFDDSLVFFYPTDNVLVGIIPQLKGKHNIDFYDMRGNLYSSKALYKEQWRNDGIDFKNIENVIAAQNKKSYIIVSTYHPSEHALDKLKEMFDIQSHNLELEYLFHFNESCSDIYEIRINNN